MKKFLKIYTFLLVICCSLAVNATMIFPPANMDEMANSCDLVVLGTVTGHIDGNPYANHFEILDVVSGSVEVGQTIPLLEYSGEDGGLPFQISGDVNFQVGTEYLLFLGAVNGGYRSTFLSLGVYEAGGEGKSILAHDISLLDVAFTNPLDASFTAGYNKNDLITHLKDIVNNNATWDINEAGVYISEAAKDSQINNEKYEPDPYAKGPCPNNAPCHCATLFGPQGPDQTKFVDNTWTVCVAGGAQDDPTTTTEITDLQTAITALNGMQGINVSYTGIDAACSPMAGCTAASNESLACAGGFGSNCNKIYVFFDDPCNQIADVDANCAGVLGIGGHFAGGTHMDLCGDTWDTACNPFFVMNNFGVCAPNTVTQDDYIAVLVHEMLHSMGIGHHYDADAFTTTTAADNPCGTGAITHDQNECTGVMNPVVCNANPPSAANNYSITSLDNACTDWMYNITSATTCAITNVTLNTAATCNGDDATFEVCFDVTDGSGAYDIEVNAQVVADAVAGATAGNVCVTATVIGPTAAGNVTVNVRDDAEFSCLDDTNLSVALPQCPPACASSCADLMSGAASDCGNTVWAPGTFGGNTSNTNFGGDGSGTGCQDFSALGGLPTTGGESYTFCTDFTPTLPDPIFVPLQGVASDNTSCFGSETVTVFDATCTDVTTQGITVNQPGGGFAGQALGLTIGTTYTACYTIDYSTGTTLSDGTTPCTPTDVNILLEYCMDIVESGVPPCAATPDVSIPTAVCNGDNVFIDFGINCVANPDLGANSGFGLVVYVDAMGNVAEAPMGSNFTFQDLIDGNPNLAFVAVNAGGCADIDFPLGIVNSTCDPLNVTLGVFPLDVVANSSFGDCPIELLTITVYPNYQVFEDVSDGCDPIAGAFATDGTGSLFDQNSDAMITFADDACFTAQLDPTADCTDGAMLNYDFEADILAANPDFPANCGGPFTGTLTCSCVTLSCTSVADPDVATACTGANFQVDINSTGACTTDPIFDDQAIFPGGVSGYIAFYYVDAAGNFTNCPAGSTAEDVLANLNPPAGVAGFAFFAESNAANGGGCSPVDVNAFINTTCDPITIPVCLLNGDVTGFFVTYDAEGDGVNEINCDIVETTVTIYPSLTAQMVSEDPANCGDMVAALFDGNGTQCAGTEMTVSCATDGVAPVASFPVDPNGCYAAQDVTGTACMGCTMMCTAAAPMVSNDGGDCDADPDGSGDNTPFVFAEDGTGNMMAPFITEYIVTDGAGGNIVGVFPNLAAAETAANAEAVANGDACIQAINHDATQLDVLVAAIDVEVTNALGVGLCLLLGPPCPNYGTLENLYNALAPLVPAPGITVADIETIITGDLSFLVPGLVVPVPDFCYALGNEDCITVAPCNTPFDIFISDPCSCTNPNNVGPGETGSDGDFDFFYEEITVTTGTAGETLTLDFGGVTTYDATGVPAPATVTDNGDGTYTVVIYLPPGTTFTLDASSATVPVGSLIVNGGGCVPCIIPTLSEWGLMTLALLLMAFGSVTIAARQFALSGIGSRNIPLPTGSNFSLPFNAAIFRKAMYLTMFIALIGFAICFALYSEIYGSDLIGVTIAGPIFAYLIHLLYLLEKNRK